MRRRARPPVRGARDGLPPSIRDELDAGLATRVSSPAVSLATAATLIDMCPSRAAACCRYSATKSRSAATRRARTFTRTDVLSSDRGRQRTVSRRIPAVVPRSSILVARSSTGASRVAVSFCSVISLAFHSFPEVDMMLGSFASSDRSTMRWCRSARGRLPRRGWPSFGRSWKPPRGWSTSCLERNTTQTPWPALMGVKSSTRGANCALRISCRSRAEESCCLRAARHRGRPPRAPRPRPRRRVAGGDQTRREGHSPPRQGVSRCGLREGFHRAARTRCQGPGGQNGEYRYDDRSPVARDGIVARGLGRCPRNHCRDR